MFVRKIMSKQEVVRLYEMLLMQGRILVGGPAHKRLKRLKKRFW